MISRAWCLLVVMLVVLATAGSALASGDPYTARQWGLRKVNAEKAWASGQGKGITVAIVDTGVDLKHEDLKGAFVPGYDFVKNDADPSDEAGHGTHVAGIAAARANNGVGVAGVAPQARIMPVRVLDANGSGTSDSIDAGVRWAVSHGADVINLSLSDGALDEAITGGSLSSTVEYAWSKGVIPVIAAGNGSLFRTEFQGAHALIVTATTPTDSKPGYATEVGFARWGIAAPGGTDADGKASMVFSTLWDKKGVSHYGWAMGTSMATPHVAGAAAILRGLGLSPQQTVDRLMSTAKDIGSSFTFGAGLLDVSAAVAGLKSAGAPSRPTRPPAETEPPSTSGTADDRPGTTAAGELGPSPTGASAVASVTSGASPAPSQSVLAADPPVARTGRSATLLAIAVGGALVSFGAALAGFAVLRRRRVGV